jgi:hypothetical protein
MTPLIGKGFFAECLTSKLALARALRMGTSRHRAARKTHQRPSPTRDDSSSAEHGKKSFRLARNFFLKVRSPRRRSLAARPPAAHRGTAAGSRRAVPIACRHKGPVAPIRSPLATRIGSPGRRRGFSRAAGSRCARGFGGRNNLRRVSRQVRETRPVGRAPTVGRDWGSNRPIKD